jgi:hypothetical protein
VVAVAQPDRQHSGALAIRAGRADQLGQRDDVRGRGDQAAEFDPQQRARHAEHIGRVAVVLQDPAGFIDAEDQGPRRRIRHECWDIRSDSGWHHPVHSLLHAS